MVRLKYLSHEVVEGKGLPVSEENTFLAGSWMQGGLAKLRYELQKTRLPLKTQKKVEVVRGRCTTMAQAGTELNKWDGKKIRIRRLGVYRKDNYCCKRN